MATTVGIDLGGTKIAGALVDEHGVVQLATRRPTPRRGGAELILRAIAELVTDLSARAIEAPTAVGVGVGGAIDVTRGAVVAATDILGDWVGTPVRDRLEAALGTTVVVDNDVKVFAIGEHRFGAGRSHRNAVYVTVGTGVGGGIFIEDRLLRGRSWSAGELGHLSVPQAEGRSCPCGRSGHLEAVAAGPAMSRRHAALTGGTELTLEEVADRARHGEPAAVEVIREGGAALGTALADIANSVDPDIIVLGGGVLALGDLFLTPARLAFQGSALEGPSSCPIVTAQLGGDAAVIGAASIAQHPVPSI